MYVLLLGNFPCFPCGAFEYTFRKSPKERWQLQFIQVVYDITKVGGGA